MIHETPPQKATRIELGNFSTPAMRAFHMSWVAFFLCFFSWFGIAPLMSVIREEFSLTKDQVGNIVIASVAITILARLLAGWCCDRYGPRITYTWLLLLGSLPVMGAGLAYDYHSFLLIRLAIGAIGASFIITQYHTSAMFAPNCVGTANATTAGWGNLGGGVTQMIMPLILTSFLWAGFTSSASWRLAMVVPGVLMIVTGLAYYRITQDTPQGNLKELRAAGVLPAPNALQGSFQQALSDKRVWALSAMYGACFGVEITIHNVASLYFIDNFAIGFRSAGLIAGSFGILAIFARTLGGWFSDRLSTRFGLRSRALLLGGVLLLEGLALMLFSQLSLLPLAVVMLMTFGLLVHVSCGATYGLVPFINPRAMGSVAGLIGAGGNVGAVASGFLFKGSLPWQQSMLVLGLFVTLTSALALLVRFSPEDQAQALQINHARRLAGAPADASVVTTS